ncbi:MAG: adenylosuccinate lyase, partial [Bdellovibrionales bacterium]|nr:adenylosuccinate lyase [Bdellovibrionales bacterium]
MIPRYSRPEMAALWSDDARFAVWLEVETLALEAMAREGIVPKRAAESVRARGKFDAKRVLEIEDTVKHDVIAFLTNVAEAVGEDARYLHYGMTSSDLLDTAFAVQLVRATDMILAGVDTLRASVRSRAEEHRHTPVVGRSHGIHAEPTTFGLKLAVFYAELGRARKRIEAARSEVAVGAISGPVGTFAHLPPTVEAYVCD